MSDLTTTSGIIQKIISHGLSKNASDWHFTAGEPLALRISGVMCKCDGTDGHPNFKITEREITELMVEHTPEAKRLIFMTESGQHLDVSDVIEEERFRLHFEWITGLSGNRQAAAVLRHIPSELPQFKSARGCEEIELS